MGISSLRHRGGQCTAVLTMRVNQMLTIFLVLLVFGSTVEIREEDAALELLEDGLSASEQLHQSSILSQSAEVDDQDAVLAGRRGPVTFKMPPNFLQQMVDDREKKRAAFKSITARIEAAEKTLAKNKQQAERHRKHQHKLDAKTTSLENKVLTGGKGGKGRTGGKGGRGSRIAQKEATCKACGTCMSIPGNPQATTDPMCAPCANGGQSWWPCDVAGLCQCKEAVTQIGKPTHAERKAAVKAAADEALADKALAEEDAKRKAAERKAADKALADEAAADKALAENTRKAADKAKADEAAADKALAEHTRKAADKKEADKAAADRLLAQHKVLAAQAALHVKRLAAAGAASKARAKAAEDKARVEKQNAKIARAKAQRILANRQRASRSANRGRGRRASANRRRKRGGKRGGKRKLRRSRSRHRKGGRRLLSHSDDLNFSRNEVCRIGHALASN